MKINRLRLINDLMEKVYAREETYKRAVEKYERDLARWKETAVDKFDRWVETVTPTCPLGKGASAYGDRLPKGIIPPPRPSQYSSYGRDASIEKLKAAIRQLKLIDEEYVTPTGLLRDIVDLI